jgi:hypothetical protein
MRRKTRNTLAADWDTHKSPHNHSLASDPLI